MSRQQVTDVLQSLMAGPQRHVDLHDHCQGALPRLWLCGFIRLRPGDWWEITHSGRELLATGATFH